MTKTIDHIITQVSRLQKKTKNITQAQRITKTLNSAYAKATPEQRQEINTRIYAREGDCKAPGVLRGTFREQLRGLLEGIKHASNYEHNARQEYFGWGQTFSDDEKIRAMRGGWFATFKGKSEARGDFAGQYAYFLEQSRASGYQTGAKAKFESREQASGHRAGRYSIKGVF